MKNKKIRTKSKRARRRSGWKHYIVLLVVLAGLWLSLGYFFAHQAEQAFRNYLSSHTEIAGEKLIRFELISYHKKLMGALGATAQLRLSSDIPGVAEHIGEVAISVKLMNGPVFITKKGVSIGSSRWLFTIDESNSTQSELENLRVLFPNRLPTITVRTDFKHQAHYFSRLDTSFAKFMLSGLYQFETAEQQENNHGSIQIEKLRLGVAPETIHAESLSISYRQNGQAVSAGYKPGLTALRSPSIIISHPYLKQAAEIGVVAKSDLSIEKEFLKGFIQLDIEQKQRQPGNELPFDTAKLSVRFSGLSAKGLVAVSEAKADLDNLKQQIDWTLEDMGEYPEGRDEIIQLNDKIKIAQKTLTAMFLDKIFQKNTSTFEAEVLSLQDNKPSKVAVSLSTQKNGNLSAKLTGQLSTEWQMALTALVDKLGESENIKVKKDFTVDLIESGLVFK